MKKISKTLCVVDFPKTFVQNMALLFFFNENNIRMSFNNLIIITASFSFARALYDINKKQ